MAADVRNFKIVLLGEGCVGKTSLVLRYVHNQFVDKHVTTIQASFLTKRLTVDNIRVNLAIWDTAGQERFHALGPIYYRDADGALLIYDITDRSSFDRVQNWVRELRKMLGDNIVLAIAGNKSDLERQRVVTLEEAESYARSVGAQHFVTSAKLNKNVTELFFHLTKEMLARSAGGGGGKKGGGGGGGGGGFGGMRQDHGGLIIADAPDADRPGTCC